MRTLLLALAAMWLTCAGTSARAADSVALHPDVWAAYQAYLELRWPGAFAVSGDGTAYGAVRCAIACDVAAAKREAIRNCGKAADADCVVFAVRDDIRLAYRVLTREEASPCPLSPIPRIEDSRSVSDLTEIVGKDKRRWLERHSTVMGATRHSLGEVREAIRYVAVDGRNGATCAGFTDGRLRLTLQATIYIAREIPKGTCLYREVLAHEQRHQSLGVELTEAFARELEEVIAAALTEQPFIPVPPGEKAEQVAADRLDEIIGAAWQTFDRERSRRQLALDSNAEYARTDLICPGEADKFLP